MKTFILMSLLALLGSAHANITCNVNPSNTMVSAGKGQRLTPGATIQMAPNGGSCSILENTTSNTTFFVPMGSVAEFNSFLANRPVGVSTSTCSSPSWLEGAWQNPASPTCGDVTQTKTVTCQMATCDSQGNIQTSPTADNTCTGAGLAKPATTQEVNLGSCVSCPAGTSLGGAGGAASPAECRCNTAGHTWCTTTLACVGTPSCPPGAELGPATASDDSPTNDPNCHCASNTAWTGTKCLAGCTAGNKTWTIGGVTCSANAPEILWAESTYITDSTAPTTGTARIRCTSTGDSNTSWPVLSDSTCTAAVTCPAGTSTTGAGGDAAPAGCKCNTSGHTWNGSTCVAPASCQSTSVTYQSGDPAPATKFCNGAEFIVENVGWQSSSSIPACNYTNIYSDCSNYQSFCLSGNATCNDFAGYGTVHDCGGDYSTESQVDFSVRCNP